VRLRDQSRPEPADAPSLRGGCEYVCVRRLTHAARIRPALSAGVLCTAAAMVSLLVRHQTGLSGDEPYYVRIANHPAGPHNFPYAFRIGVPYIVHILPLPHRVSWQLLALLAAGVSGGAMFALMREVGASTWLARWLALGFSVSPPLWVVFLRNGRSVDPATIMVIALGCMFIVRRQRLRFAATLLFGITVHESCLFLVPVAYAVWARRPVDLDALRDLALAALLPVILYVYLRVSIVAVGERYQPGYTGGVLEGRVDILRDALSHGGWRTELRRLALVYGPLWLAAPLALRRSSLARRLLVLVALCVGSMTFALDWGRAIFFAAPAFYAGGAIALTNRRRLAILSVVALLAVDVGYGVYMQVHGVVHGLNSSAPPARGPVY
jgi:hypothetical protein